MKLRSLALTSLMVLASFASAGDEVGLPLDRTISVDFPTESRKTIIRNVADLYQLNVVWPEECPDEPTPMKLRDVTWDVIFDLALSGSGFMHFRRGNVVWIVSVGDSREELMQWRDIFVREINENMRLRDVIRLLVTADTPPLAEEQRDQITQFLSNPNRSAAELLELLKKDGPNPAGSTEG